jgi:large subunit ribosomal protein L30
MPGKLRITQTKSTISHIARNRATIKALGLHGIGSSVEVVDNEATRGMVRQVRFLVSLQELPLAAQASSAQGRARRTSERGSTVGDDASRVGRAQRNRDNEEPSRMGGEEKA